jgi:GNAT superfamily N-acetyltransferase
VTWRSPSYTVHEAELDDVPVLTELRWQMCMEQGVAPPGTRAAYEAAFLEFLRATMPGGSCRCWLARDERGQAVGAVTLWSFPLLPRPGIARELHGWVSNLFTLPEHRRRGVANLLLRSVTAAAGADGVTHLLLDPAPGTEPVYAALGYQAGHIMEAEVSSPVPDSTEP